MASVKDGVEHVYWWLSRGNRIATCRGCQIQKLVAPEAWIATGEFRLVYDPDPRSISDYRAWKDRFVKYYHIRASCLVGLDAPMEPPLKMEIEPMKGEAPEERLRNTTNAVELAYKEFAASRALRNEQNWSPDSGIRMDGIAE